ncbi:MAG: ankyrin repeat domain-containing protein, partial [Verrucomicrobiales bacterium]
MNSNNKLKVRYHDLDALRSFAMILGIAIHGVFSFNGMPIWPAQDINQNPQYGVVAEFIHGFRMQLFFLVSGFFTAMMLLKKGSFAVSMHRTKRILIPLLLSVILLVPLMNNMTKLNEFKENFGKEKSEISSKASIKGSSIWAAAKRDDIELLEKKISEGFDVNKKDYLQATPLHWAAAYGNTESIDLLLKNGADIDAGDGKNSTPLHWASFMARPDSVKLLIDNNASVEKRNSDGS